ncbi:MAG: molybdopterin-synthase adenylyltransferase MoeB [Gemmatimonadetes bacterium]|nr:molybdopterin-synthase adenylyltransferase MoeB [Gemmatimonadota bacterium]
MNTAATQRSEDAPQPAHSGNDDWSQDERVRYARHFTLPEVGAAGQGRLRSSRVLIVGAGGLGSPVALYLAAAGVGTLGLVDFDTVDLSNLQRQILHGSAAVGTSKLESAAARIADLNPHVAVECFPERLTSDNAFDILRPFDIVVDGSDNFPTRYLINDACVLLGKPYVYGAIFRFEGQASLFAVDGGPCYRCLYAEPPPADLVPTCAEGGVLGVLPGIIGSIQALETIKWILELGDSLAGRLLLFDGLAMKLRELTVRKDPACPVCGEHPTVRELLDYQAFCGVGAEPGIGPMEVAVATLDKQLEQGMAVQLVDVRERYEWDICRLPGARHIPLGQLQARLGELDSGLPIIAYCHTGVRSLRAAQILVGAGYRSLSLAGGVEAWAREIDPTMARY